MPRRHHVVIVAQNPSLGAALLAWLGAAGYELAIATTFAAGKALLEFQPALLISEVKLGEYNGLHLALKATAAGVPAVVIGPKDTVLERDAQDLGVMYISSVLRRKQLLELIAELTRSANVVPKPSATQSHWPVESESLASPAPPNRILLH